MDAKTNGGGDEIRTHNVSNVRDFKSRASRQFRHSPILPHSEAFARLTTVAQNDKVSTLDNQVVRKTLLQKID